MATNAGGLSAPGPDLGADGAPPGHLTPGGAGDPFRALAEAVPDAIVSADQDGRITFFNPRAEQLFGYPAAEAIGQPLTLLIPERFHAAHTAGVARYLATRTPQIIGRTVELTARRKDGTEIPVDLSLATWTLDGRVHFTGILRDVSERSRAAEEARARAAALEATTRRLNTLVQSGLALTSSLDIESILQAVVQAATRLVNGRGALIRLLTPQGRLEIRALHGLSEAYLARSGMDLSRSKVAGRVLEERRPFVIRDVDARSDLPLRDLLVAEGVRSFAGVPVAHRGRVLGVLTVFAAAPDAFGDEDVAILSLLAEQAAVALDHARLFRESEQRGARLAEQTREMEAFTYTVSHDLKTPLRAMDGYARALVEDYADRLDDMGRRYVDRIRAAARRMGELIDDLLHYSRIERREMAWGTVTLPPMVAAIADEVREELQRRGISFRVELSVEQVRGDADGLRAALTNLIGNAVKFTRGPGGTVTVGSRREGDAVVLWVADTGIGFDMKYHDRIFRIFERLNRDDEYPGTGVGLAIVRKVADRHGGRVWATSEPDKGSTFHLALPAERGVNG